jgi:RimJ/RimL family protein N-acetyltransferase
MALSTPLPTIRPASLDDVDRVIELLWAVAADGRWLGTEVPFDRVVRRAGLAALVSGENGTLIVADAGGPDRGPDVVGHITVGVASYGVADIGMLLAEEWRGRGLGTALLEAGLDWAARAGAHKAALEVWPHNEAALALYKRAGFNEEGRNPAVRARRYMASTSSTHPVQSTECSQSISSGPTTTVADFLTVGRGQRPTVDVVRRPVPPGAAGVRSCHCRGRIRSPPPHHA